MVDYNSTFTGAQVDAAVAAHVAGGSPASLGGAWTQHDTWDFSVDGAVADVTFTGLDEFTDIMFVIIDLQLSATTNSIVRFSVDGITFDATVGDYKFMNANGEQLDSSVGGVFYDSTHTTDPRGSRMQLFNTATPFTSTLNTGLVRHYAANPGPITDALILTNAPANFTAGKIICYGR